MTETTSGVPDLLQRFVPTPFSASFTIDDADVTLHSNADLAANHQATTSHGASDKITGTIVHDPEAPNDGSDIIVIKAWPVATVLVGTGTVLALDCERSEIVGFLSPAVSSVRLVNELLPMMVELYRQLKSNVELQHINAEYE
jgi:hypothetical protein